MALVVANEGRRLLLDILTGVGSRSNWGLGLYKSSHAPASTDTVTTYTAIVSTYDGYSGQPVTGWTSAATSSGVTYSVATSLNYQPTGTGGGAQSAYGYFAYAYASDVTVPATLLWAEAFGSPFDMSGTSDILTIIPRLEFNNC